MQTPPESSTASAAAGGARAAGADPWVQILACLALMSGGFCAHRYLHPGAAPGASQASDAEPPPAVGPDPSLPESLAMPARREIAVPSPSPLPSEAPPTAPSATGAGVALLGKPKSAGNWIVDGAMGPGADRASLAEALASAQDDDVITVRPGRYQGPFVVSRSLTIVGVGMGPDDVVLDSDGPLTVAVAGGKVSFKNLAISNSGTRYTTAFSVIKAEARLEGVHLKAVGQGARVSRGTLTLAGCTLAARIALIAEDNAHLSAADCAVSGTDVGALLKGDAIAASFTRCKFSDSERGVNIEGRSKLSVDHSEFSLTGVGGGIFLFSGAQASVKTTTFLLRESSRVGLYVQNATLEADHIRIQDSRRSGLIATGESSVRLDDVTITHNAASGVTADKGARVTLRRATVSDNSDCGLQVNDAAVILEKVTLTRNRCGAGFFGPGSLEAHHSTFSEQALGPVAVTPGFETAVVLKGADNEGFSAVKPAAPGSKDRTAPRTATAPSQGGRTRFSHDIFNKYDAGARR